jgi:hypothetical protein
MFLVATLDYVLYKIFLFFLGTLSYSELNLRDHKIVQGLVSTLFLDHPQKSAVFSVSIEYFLFFVALCKRVGNEVQASGRPRRKKLKS